jgi:hypothetical protein
MCILPQHADCENFKFYLNFALGPWCAIFKKEDTMIARSMTDALYRMAAQYPVATLKPDSTNAKTPDYTFCVMTRDLRLI